MKSYMRASPPANHDEIRRKVRRRIRQFITCIVHNIGIIGDRIDQQCLKNRQWREAMIGNRGPVHTTDSGVLEKYDGTGHGKSVIS